jgi:uncharacterized lipoprotein YmbA
MRDQNLMIGFGIVVTMMGLSGCAGSIRYPSYYALDVPVAPSPRSVAKPVLSSVAVREFRSPTFLKEGPIVYRPSPEQIDFYDYHRWADDPRRAVTEAMVREIRARGLAQSVDTYDGHESPECIITGTLDHLEEIDNGQAVSVKVSLSARLSNVRTGEVLWADTSTKTATLDHRSVDGVVSEMSAGLGAAVSSLVSSMQERLSSTAPPSKSGGE